MSVFGHSPAERREHGDASDRLHLGQGCLWNSSHPIRVSARVIVRFRTRSNDLLISSRSCVSFSLPILSQACVIVIDDSNRLTISATYDEA